MASYCPGGWKKTLRYFKCTFFIYSNLADDIFNRVLTEVYFHTGTILTITQHGTFSHSLVAGHRMYLVLFHQNSQRVTHRSIVVFVVFILNTYSNTTAHGEWPLQLHQRAPRLIWGSGPKKLTLWFRMHGSHRWNDTLIIRNTVITLSKMWAEQNYGQLHFPSGTTKRTNDEEWWDTQTLIRVIGSRNRI